MHKIKGVFVLIILIISSISFSQEATYPKITGTVKDAQTGEPLYRASVALLNPGDSTIAKGTITDSTGQFKLQAAPGEYMLKVQYVSHQPEIKSAVRLRESKPSKNLGTISLMPDQKQLSEFVVSGEQSRMTMQGGKKIFNVGTDLSNSGASAAEVLDNIPAVTTDIEGNISLRGSQGVRILVNGKPSSMMGLSGSEILRYFPANQIKRVEIITNPSAKYEAQGAAGIINIILKEGQNWGLNGQFTLEAGHPKDHGASVRMNYRKKWYNIFGSYNVSTDEHPGGGWRKQTYNLPDTTYSLWTDRDRTRGGVNHNFQFGSDFYFTPNDVLKISGVYSVANEDNYTDLTFRDYTGNQFAADNLTRRTIRDELEEEKEGEYELNMNYEKTFGEDDHKLTADLQARSSVETEDASLVETMGLPGESQDTALFQNSLNDTDVQGYLAKLDYTYPFSEDGKFETGFRGEYRTIENKYNVEQRPSAAEPWNTLDRFSNTFFYDEEIYGVYAMYGNRRGAFSYQAGIRFEYTRIDTELLTDEAANERSYYDLFPSASLTYHITETNSVQASYSRRLDRPYFRELNPYNTFSNNRNYRTGNPLLDPEYTGAYDLGYINNKEERSVYVGAFYRRTVNEIENVDTVNTEGITISKPFNLASRDNAGIETRYSNEIFDWWDFSISSYFYHGSTSGYAAGESLNNSSYTMDARASFNFDVRNWFEFEVNADYRAPEKEGQDTEEAMYEVDMGLRKDFLNNRGHVSFSARDVFNTDVYRSRVDGSNFEARQKFQWRSGTFFSLSISYELKDTDAERDESHIFEQGQGGSF